MDYLFLSLLQIITLVITVNIRTITTPVQIIFILAFLSVTFIIIGGFLLSWNLASLKQLDSLIFLPILSIKVNRNMLIARQAEAIVCYKLAISQARLTYYSTSFWHGENLVGLISLMYSNGCEVKRCLMFSSSSLLVTSLILLIHKWNTQSSESSKTLFFSVRCLKVS